MYVVTFTDCNRTAAVLVPDLDAALPFAGRRDAKVHHLGPRVPPLQLAVLDGKRREREAQEARDAVAARARLLALAVDHGLAEECRALGLGGVEAK